jgi:hypothetical protein
MQARFRIAISLSIWRSLMIPLRLLPAPPTSETPSFLGIEWGASREEVAHRMIERRGVRISESLSEETLGFQGGIFAGITDAGYQLGFVDGRFRHALVYFLPRSRSEATALYARLRQYLLIRHCWLEPEISGTRGEIESHCGRGSRGRVSTGISRLDEGYLVTAIITGRSSGRPR